ncbi:MAG: hypothetical protein HUU57_14305 [Bdellovibrio sp.]|nr:hypothetical protein [Bdellovibrio sp.]
MKNSLLVALIMSASFAQASTLPCSVFEASFQGTVKSIESVDGDTCRIKVNLHGKGNFQANPECPLAQYSVEESGMLTKECSYQVGESISGYAVAAPGASENEIYKDPQ